MSVIPQARFQEFIQDIEPSTTTKANAASAHAALRDFLKKDSDFSKYHVDDFLSGSYKRDTAIRPLKNGGQIDRPDIDIVVVTNHSVGDDPGKVVDLLYQTLKKKYPKIRRQNRSVGIEQYNADMDVIPAIKSGDAYLIPDRDTKTWIFTNPERHTSWTTETNKRANGRFKPLVKLFKWYRRQNATISEKPKGFSLECMVAECMDYNETDYGELFVKMLESIANRYNLSVSAGIVPIIADPAIPGNSVTNDIGLEEFRGFFNKIKSHAKLGREALTSTDLEKATSIFCEIFGDCFPKTMSRSRESTLAKPETLSSTSFPDRAIKPNKPSGFADVVP